MRRQKATARLGGESDMKVPSTGQLHSGLTTQEMDTVTRGLGESRD